MQVWMIFKSVIIFCAASLIISGCQTEPAACFELNKENYLTGEPVLFDNCSADADEFIWDFGDSVISSDKNPVHVYSDTGSFEIKLSASSHNGNKSDYCSRIIQIDAANEKFTGIYLAEFQDTACELKIIAGVTVNSIVLYFNDVLFCNASVSGYNLAADAQNYWNDDYQNIQEGAGILTENAGNYSLVINFIVTDINDLEHIISITATKLDFKRH
jgi:hypothetical protein